MALLARETFDYTIDSQLGNKAGGSGWSSNWTATNSPIKSPISGNDNKVVTPSYVYSDAGRYFNEPISGIIEATFYVRKSASNSMMYFGVKAGGKEYSFKFNVNDFSRLIANGSNYTQDNPFTSNNTWYKIRIYINKNTSTDNVIFYVDDNEIRKISTSISSISTPQIFFTQSGYNIGISYTDITIADGTVDGSSKFFQLF